MPQINYTLTLGRAINGYLAYLAIAAVAIVPVMLWGPDPIKEHLALSWILILWFAVSPSTAFLSGAPLWIRLLITVPVAVVMVGLPYFVYELFELKATDTDISNVWLLITALYVFGVSSGASWAALRLLRLFKRSSAAEGQV